MKCAVCYRDATKKFVNPSNPDDTCWYCDKHFAAISKAFGKFEELYHYEKNIQQNPFIKQERGE